MWNKIISAFLAVLLACFTWYLVTGQEDVETWIQLPVELVNPPPGLLVRSGLIRDIQIRVRGPKGMVRNLDTTRMAYSFNMSSLKVGKNVVDFKAKNLPLSKALEVMEITPARMILTVDMLGQKDLPVVPNLQGNIDKDLELSNWKSTPGTVTVKGGIGLLDSMDQVLTMPIELSIDSPAEFSEQLDLDLPQELDSSPPKVSMDLVFSYKKRRLWVKVPIEYKLPKGKKVQLEYKYARLHVEGPRPFFRQDDFRKRIKASLVVPEDAGPGEHSFVYRVNLPGDCSLIKAKPTEVTLRVN